MEGITNITSNHMESYKSNVNNVAQKMANNLQDGNSTQINKSENSNEKINDNDKSKNGKQNITKEKVQELTKKLNEEMEKLNPDIEFNYNEKIDNFVVNVIDKKTDRVIRKFPSDEAVKIMEKMQELTGALFDKKG